MCCITVKKEKVQKMSPSVGNTLRNQGRLALCKMSEKQNNRFDTAREFMYSIHLITAAQAAAGVDGGKKSHSGVYYKSVYCLKLL